LQQLENQVHGAQRQLEFWELKRILQKLQSWLSYLDEKLQGSPDQQWLRNSLRLLYSLPIICPQTRTIEEMLVNENNRNEETIDKLDALATIAFGILSQEETLKRKIGSILNEEDSETRKKKIPNATIEEFPSKSTDGTRVESRRPSPIVDTPKIVNTPKNPPLMAETPPPPRYDPSYYGSVDPSYYGYYPSHYSSGKPHSGTYDPNHYPNKPRDTGHYEKDYAQSYYDQRYYSNQGMTSTSVNHARSDPNASKSKTDGYDNRNEVIYPPYPPPEHLYPPRHYEMHHYPYYGQYPPPSWSHYQ
jgi:hypothetical protein